MRVKACCQTTADGSIVDSLPGRPGSLLHQHAAAGELPQPSTVRRHKLQNKKVAKEAGTTREFAPLAPHVPSCRRFKMRNVAVKHHSGRELALAALDARLEEAQIDIAHCCQVADFLVHYQEN